MYDIAIVGGGLAGSSIAMMLSRAHRVLLVDREDAGAGSTIPAGLVNPIMTRQGARVWHAEEALESLQRTTELANANHLVRMHGLYRPAISEKQISSFKAVSEEYPDLSNWISAGEMNEMHPEVHAPVGALHVTAGGVADIPGYILSMQTSAASCGAVIRREEVKSIGSLGSFYELVLGDGERIQANRVIVAAGSGCSRFSQLAGLHLHLIKGQVVVVRRPEGLKAIPLLSGSGYLVDRGDTLLAGSSYHHEFADAGVEEEVLRQLVSKAAVMVPALVGAAIVSGHAGIRVTVPGTYLPMVGAVDEDRRLWVVTGLGSKGLLMSAWIADRIESFITGRQPVPGELNVRHA